MGANQVKLWREMTASEDATNSTTGDSVCNNESSGNSSGNSTPTRPSTLKTLPSFKDPRSPPNDPTDSRTPIQVEATPGTKNAARTFDDTPLMQKVLRRGTFDATPNSPSPATPVKSLDLSSSYEGTESKENLPAYQEEKVSSENSRSALTSKNKWFLFDRVISLLHPRPRYPLPFLLHSLALAFEPFTCDGTCSTALHDMIRGGVRPFFFSAVETFGFVSCFFFIQRWFLDRKMILRKKKWSVLVLILQVTIRPCIHIYF